jgi:hypothetical protein
VLRIEEVLEEFRCCSITPRTWLALIAKVSSWLVTLQLEGLILEFSIRGVAKYEAVCTIQEMSYKEVEVLVHLDIYTGVLTITYEDSLCYSTN